MDIFLKKRFGDPKYSNIDLIAYADAHDTISAG